MPDFIILLPVGYKTIAIDQSFDHSRKEAAKRGSEMFPEPHKVDHLRKEFVNKLRILQRITILYVDVNVAHAMVNRALNFLASPLIFDF